MNKIKLVAIDLAKRCYQVGAIDQHGKLMYQPQATRRRSLRSRCSSSSRRSWRWRRVQQRTTGVVACMRSGHEVRLVPPQHAKAFRRVHKSDAHDTLSIAEAAQRPNIHFVPVKSIAQQDLQSLGRIRERLIAQRTAIINQARGLAREYGVNFAKSSQALHRAAAAGAGRCGQ